MTQQAVDYLRSCVAIRERCQQLLRRAEDGDLRHFAYVPERLEAVVTYVVDVIHETYPTLAIPFHSRWRHFDVDGVDRWAQWQAAGPAPHTPEGARCALDLVITSVLLDAGAGPAWQYREPATGRLYRRSEGLAVASWHLWHNGLFSSQADAPWQADAAGLRGITTRRLSAALQVHRGNPLVGVAGRAALLRRLGERLQAAPTYFGTYPPRLGHLFDYLYAQASRGRLAASRILAVVLDSLGPIWPGRLTLGVVNLGDVWRHSLVTGDGLTAGLVPFHKLSQWLTYSLIEPLQVAGLTVTGLDALTGLAEYRNGGLLLDLGLLTPRHDGVFGRGHRPGAELVVEWRALTVALLDCLADRIRQRLGVTMEVLPLVKILEGGTWRAGRKIAAERRADGAPPLRIVSDGTVF